MHSMRASACICTVASRETDSTELWSCVVSNGRIMAGACIQDQTKSENVLRENEHTCSVPIQHMRDSFCTINLPEAFFNDHPAIILTTKPRKVNRDVKG